MVSKKRLVAILIFLVALSAIAAVFDYEPLWHKINSGGSWNLGLDLAGGSLLTYQVDLSKVNSADQDSVVTGLRDVIERRVNLFGVSEPRVYTENAAGTTRLVVELAGIRDVNQAIKEIGATPFLDFREVVPTASTTTAGNAGIKNSASSTIEFIPTTLNGRYIIGAQLNLNSVTREPEVAIQFNDEGGKIFADLTTNNIGKPLAIFLDNELIEMPTVKEAITGGKAQISGNFTIDSARQLVERFNAGALPAPVTLVNQETISPDFGKEALDRAIFAGFLGLAIVILFMIFYYRQLGIFAAFALLMYTALTLAIFKILPVTMTLSGIAGFILSIGMAVDANILVFERTKEELKKGLSHYSAIEEGFRRAWTSIRDSNISTLITAAVLYYFTSSFVRGFALTLFIGVLVSMFSAITITRTMLRIFIGQDKEMKK
ncbi:MAG: protein translocase subunit SecD [Minisyncoccia bacterium]|jgi:protein-export membrane protein SecD